jgi:uncharacterized OB-fold protein
MEPSIVTRLRSQLMRLHGGECGACPNRWLGSRLCCQRCGSEETNSRTYPSIGILRAFSVADAVPEQHYSLHPFQVGLVQLKDGPFVLAIITDSHDLPLKIGMVGELVTRRISSESDASLVVYGYKFRPLNESFE